MQMQQRLAVQLSLSPAIAIAIAVGKPRGFVIDRLCDESVASGTAVTSPGAGS